MWLYALTIFLSAFLLFQVQPLIGKSILPWFGGGPAVWTTCMLFFQSALLAGYAYAHLLRTRVLERRQAWIHLAVLAAACCLLPIYPSAGWKPHGSEAPVWHILLILSVAVGLPYFALSATSPLLQAWFNVSYPGKSPYKLYALSNVGSLLALASYPFVLEPLLRLKAQAISWSIAFGAFAVLCAWCALKARRDAPPGPLSPQAAEGDAPLPGWVARALWVALPACGSVMLLAVTNQMCSDVAVVPFLWVLPLALYLLSFILCFQSDRIYWRPLWLPLLGLAVASIIWLLYQDVYASMNLQIAVYSGGLFICCMVCHGELARLRPAPRHLTGFYLASSAGGAIGGLLVTLAAPMLLKGYYELHIGLVACLVLAAVALAHELAPHGRWKQTDAIPLFWFGSGSIVVAAAISLGFHVYKDSDSVVSASRNFYGVLKVEGYGKEGTADERYILRHGRILHGTQYTAEPLRSTATKYYWEKSGVGLAILNRRPAAPMKVGVVGLGTGTIAAYGRRGDDYRFYEINPQVLKLSGPEGTRFTYVADCRARGARCEVVMGDARLSLEQELASGRPQGFDVLALDAFSSDAIPVHLLTEEAVEIYRRHLKPDGILAVHISNRFLDLEPVVVALAQHFDMGMATIEAGDDDKPENSNCTWILVTDDGAFLDIPAIREATSTDKPPKPHLWTDDYSDLFSILR